MKRSKGKICNLDHSNLLPDRGDINGQIGRHISGHRCIHPVRGMYRMISEHTYCLSRSIPRNDRDRVENPQLMQPVAVWPRDFVET